MKHEMPLDHLALEKLARFVHTKFLVHSDASQVVEVDLVEATRLQRTDSLTTLGSPERWESFSVVFNGPEQSPLAQGTYRFDHEELGSFALFIVPVGQERGSRQYQAVFNRTAS
jgi:hypothetical protein